MKVGIDFGLLSDWDGSRKSFLDNEPVKSSLACLEELTLTVGRENVFVVVNSSNKGARERKWLDFRNVWALGLDKENVLIGLDAAALANLDVFLSSDLKALSLLSGRGKLLFLFQRLLSSSSPPTVLQIHPSVRPVFDSRDEKKGKDELEEQWFRCLKLIAEGVPKLRLRPFDSKTIDWMMSTSAPSSTSGPTKRVAHKAHRTTRASHPTSSFCGCCGDDGEADCSLCELDRDLEGRPVTFFRVLRGMFMVDDESDQSDADEGLYPPSPSIQLHLQDHGGGLVYDSTNWTWYDLYRNMWPDQEGPATLDLVRQKRRML
jgi:hypothetical protein